MRPEACAVQINYAAELKKKLEFRTLPRNLTQLDLRRGIRPRNIYGSRKINANSIWREPKLGRRKGQNLESRIYTVGNSIKKLPPPAISRVNNVRTATG